MSGEKTLGEMCLVTNSRVGGRLGEGCVYMCMLERKKIVRLCMWEEGGWVF